MKQDTIAAIATGMSTAGIGIVRISGEDAFAIIDRIYKGKSEKKLSQEPSHTIHYGYICDGEEVIDEVLVMLMRGPHSYTGEDAIEIDTHGGIYVCKRVLETVLKYGASPAQPGEFTKRAFLNGRMDLSQAEAVIDLIDSKNEYARKNSVNQLKGRIQQQIQHMREKIIYHTAFIETALDDPEHISVDGYGEKLSQEMQPVMEEIQKLIDTADNGRFMSEGIKTVIVGKPNAGKSSLLNVLVGEEKAIVTDIEGTTRDSLEEHINLSGVSLNIVDTAGIRETDDQVEKIGVDRALSHLEDSDLVIYVVDSSRELDENDRNIINKIKNKNVIILLNKTDLDTVVNKKVVKDIIDKPIIQISAKEEKGIQDFEEYVKDMFFQGNLEFNDEVYITNVRQKNALIQAKASLERVMDSIHMGMPEDFYSIDLMDAYEELGAITGETIGEDLANEIFSKFCMGK